MLYSCQSGISRKSVWLMPAICTISTFLGSFLANSQSTIPVQSAWQAGPINVSLGNIAHYQVLGGYQFTDTAAREILGKNGNEVPKGLLGCVAQNDKDGKLVVFEYDEVGFMADDGVKTLDPKDLLSVFGARAKQRAHAKETTWELPPTYDAAKHRAEWAIRMKMANGSEMANYSSVVFTRRGALTLTIVYKGLPDPEAMRVLANKLTLDKGEAYTDHLATDKSAKMTVAQFLTRQPEMENFAGIPKWLRIGEIAFWGGISVCVLAGLTALVLVVKRGREEQSARPAPVQQTSAKTVSSPVLNPAGNASTLEKAAATASSAAAPKPAAPTTESEKTKAAPAPIVAKPRATFVARNINGSTKRKREFDYNRYFADLMSTVSGHGSGPETSSPNGYPLDLGQLVPGALPGNTASASPGPAFNANSELIANQTTLIEEQRRLIQEQTKLIEEKSRLIAEKNQLLKLQRELMENKIL